MMDLPWSWSRSSSLSTSTIESQLRISSKWWSKLKSLQEPSEREREGDGERKCFCVGGYREIEREREGERQKALCE